MRQILAIITMGAVCTSAHAMLPTPVDSGEVSFVATPTANPHAPTINRTIIEQSASQKQHAPKVDSTPVAFAPLQQAIILPPVSALQTQNAINPVVNVFVVRQEAGQEVLVPVNLSTAVKSGDVLEYQGLFTNQGERVRSMDVTLSIADGLELIGGLSPEFAHASADGSRFVRMPIRARINGEVQVLPLSYYKALRWTLEDVGIGGTAVVKYRAKVL